MKTKIHCIEHTCHLHSLTFQSLIELYYSKKEIFRKDWMFKLVGSEVFEVAGYAKCEIIISASSGFSYEYTLLVNGKQLTKFKEKQTKIMKTWLFNVQGHDYRVVLGILFWFSLLFFFPFPFFFFFFSLSSSKKSNLSKT